MKHPDRERAEWVDWLFERLSERLASARRPVATYRLQLGPSFRFADARDLLPYLDGLGISDLYTSPLLRAAPGSPHGYEVFDHNALNPELGTDEDLAALTAELRARGMGHVLDLVPNHMGIVGGNRFWLDVLEHGPSSPYASLFDIDWAPVKDELKKKVLLPILGDQFGVVLERGELRLSREKGRFVLHYWEHRFPVAPGQYPLILGHRIDELRAKVGASPGIRTLLGQATLDEQAAASWAGAEDRVGSDGAADPAVSASGAVEELESIICALRKLSHPSDLDPEAVRERRREVAVARRRIEALCRQSSLIREHLDENLRIFNGTPGDPRSFDLLDELLADQAYRLAYWRVAGEEINYRRFFDLNALAAIRMEDPEVFEYLHRYVFRLIDEGQVTGLRVDHPDGLLCPRDYFRRLQEGYVMNEARRLWEERSIGPIAFEQLEPMLRERYQALHAAQPAAVGAESPLFRPLYVIAEKILGGGERIPGGWAIHGTTGYDFANALNGLFVARDNARAMTDIFSRFLGTRLKYSELVYRSKKLITGSSMVSEMNVLAHRLNRISEQNRRTRDFTLNSLRAALVELVAVFPIYRTYIDFDGQVDDRDRAYIEWAIAKAKRRASPLDPSIFDFIADVLLGRVPGGGSGPVDPEVARKDRLELTLKLQQLTGPVMAKGLEDTTFYIFNRLVSLNEVGGEPEHFGTLPQAFHEQNRQRLVAFPHSLLATSTHDTKRSEDVRARISVLSEVPGEWKTRLFRWHRWNSRHKTERDGMLAPDRNEEVLFYQTLVGAWPDDPNEARSPSFVERLKAYMAKAVKEGKVNTSWLDPDPAYERAVVLFVERAMSTPAFVSDVEDFVRRLAPGGYQNALSQTLLKVVSPGVPDIYQGTELWDRSLVDPDNRRPVDFARRRQLLNELRARLAAGDRAELARELWQSRADGRVKLYVLMQALALRKARPTLFLEGDYVVPEVQGPRREHLVVVQRSYGDESAVAIAPRLTTRLGDEHARAGAEGSPWGETRIVLSGELAAARRPDARSPGGRSQGAAWPAAPGPAGPGPAGPGPAVQWIDVFTGRAAGLEATDAGVSLRVAPLLDAFPVALLHRQGRA